MNREYLKQLVDEVKKIEKTEPENEILWKINYDKRLTELSKDLGETIGYLDTCSKEELTWMSEVFEELTEHFQSPELVECVERNIDRFPDEDLQNELKTELNYMKMTMERVQNGEN